MSRTWFPARSPAGTNRPLRLLLLLAAAGLWACSDDSSSGPPDDPDDPELPDFPAGESQVDAATRAAIADIIADAADATGAASDPEAAGVLGALGATFLSEGRITGVTASSSAIRGDPTVGARMVDGTWGVFGVAVALFPDQQSPVQAYYTGVVALNGSEAAIGIKKANTEPEIQDAHADFPHPKAAGYFFQGQTRGWGAIDGYMQVIPKEANPCDGEVPFGVICHTGTHSFGLEILASVPLQFSGNQASGSRSFLLAYGDRRGYYLWVYCDQVDFC
jgi:hypothetical protein